MPGGLFEPAQAWVGAGPYSLELARTGAFTVLVLTQLFNCFNARSETASAFTALFSNRWLWGTVALSAAPQVAVVHLSFLNLAFGTVPLSAGRLGRRQGGPSSQQDYRRRFGRCAADLALLNAPSFPYVC